MKIILFTVMSMLMLSPTLNAQASNNIEKIFEAKRAKLKKEHFREGEDASSGYDYLFYLSGKNIVKIRIIWSATHSKVLKIDDLYFDNGIRLQRSFTSPRRDLSVLTRGREAVLTATGSFEFTNGKMTVWIVKGKPRPLSDPDWSKTEAEILQNASDHLENYAFLKGGH